jgi:hypothetical protein
MTSRFPREREEPEGRRRRRGPVRKGLLYDWNDPAGRRRNVRSIGGVIVGAVCLAAFLYFRLVVPATATLTLEFEVKAPAGVSVDVNETHSMSMGSRHRSSEWEIELHAVVRNRTEKALTIGNLRAELRDEGGKRIALRSPSIDTLVPEGAGTPGSLFLMPGKTLNFNLPVPLRIKAGGGENRVRGTIRVVDVSTFDKDFVKGVEDR